LDGQGHLLIGDGTTIHEYTTLGALVNPSFILVPYSIGDILVVPEPNGLLLVGLGLLTLALVRPRQ
jgi:hypothetical protein